MINEKLIERLSPRNISVKLVSFICIIFVFRWTQMMGTYE